MIGDRPDELTAAPIGPVSWNLEHDRIRVVAEDVAGASERHLNLMR